MTAAVGWVQPDSLADALAHVVGGAAPFGGGAALMSAAFAVEPGALAVDVLPVLPIGVDGDVVGAATTIARLAADHEVRTRWPAVAAAAALTATPQVRALATLGGTVATRLPTADLPAALAAHGAIVQIIEGAGELREMSIVDYLGAPSPAAHLVVGVRLTIPGLGAYRRFALRLGPAPAIATVAGVRTTTGEARLWAGACGHDAAPIPVSPAGDVPADAVRGDARASTAHRVALVRALAAEVTAALGSGT